MDRKYKNPLKQTRTIDNWKCPYCRNIITKRPKAMEKGCFDIGDGEFEEECPICKKVSKIFISPMYIAEPIEDI